MKNIILTTLSLILIASACTKEIDTTKEPLTNDIIGTWVLENSKDVDGNRIYFRSDTFDFGKQGYHFSPDSTCTLRLKVQCGNPPIFDNIEGSYIKTEDTIKIKYFRNRKNEFKLLIKALTHDTLRVKRFY